jgi:hypothetical protein
MAVAVATGWLKGWARAEPTDERARSGRMSVLGADA